MSKKVDKVSADLSAKKKSNLAVLQAEDASISDILDQSTHVEVYKFDPASAKWDRYGVAGSAFVVTCSSGSAYKFIVLNKQGMLLLIT